MVGQTHGMSKLGLQDFRGVRLLGFEIGGEPLVLLVLHLEQNEERIIQVGGPVPRRPALRCASRRRRRRDGA